MKKIYIGNLSFDTTEEKLSEVFSKFGEISSVTILKDSISGLSKGFGFIEMEDDSALVAISSTNGKEIDGRKVRVSEAVDKSTQNQANRKKFFDKKTNRASNFKKIQKENDNEF